ncbi:hypothetical protein KKH38_01405 [Patescibacteria group bacterium]|nr:hypothetical protein [Patescibacteria group bacterium]MBU4600866.1 hypothetical protein [Patescibacteria group bacterium]MCG2698094.1 hypothetical protein [Candidatus Parcubacteria bacterium]
MIKEQSLPNINNFEKQPVEAEGFDMEEKNRDYELPLEKEKESSMEIMKQMAEYYNKLKELKGKSGTEKINKIKNFIGGSKNQQAKINRVKAFLSLEQDPDMGDRIMHLGERLKEKPKLADKVFAEYAANVDSAEKNADELAKLYNEIFFEKQIDRNKAKMAMLKNAGNLLYWANEGLFSCEEQEKEDMINDLILQLRRQEKAQKAILNDLKSLAATLNKKYKEINDLWRKKDWDEEIELQAHFLEQDGFSKKEIESHIEAMDEPIENYIASIEEKDEIDKQKKYDSERIKKIINKLENYYRENLYLDSILKLSDFAKIWQVDESQAKKILEDKRLYQEERYKPFVGKFKILLKFQQSFEQKIDQFIYGDGMPELPEGVKQEAADLIFQKYQEIIDQTKITKIQLKALFKNKKKVSDEEIDQATEIIIKKADNLLHNFAQRFSQDEKIDEKEIINELENYKANLILTASVWKAADKEGINFEDLEDVSSERKTAGEITEHGKTMKLVNEIYDRETSKKQPFIPGGNIRSAISQYAAEASPEERERAGEILEMINIYSKQYAHKPKLREKLIQGFIDKLNTAGDKTAIYSFKKGGHVLAFDRFDDLGKGKKYFGSFNVLPALTDSAIGSALLRASLDKEAEQSAEIEADCEPEKLISSYYIEKAGFVVKKIIPDYGDAGITAFNISRKKENSKYYYRDYKAEDLKKEHENNFSNNKFNKDDQYIILKFESNDGKPIENEQQIKEMLDQAGDLINSNGYVMTRYIFSKDRRAVYCALEREGS